MVHRALLSGTVRHIRDHNRARDDELYRRRRFRQKDNRRHRRPRSPSDNRNISSPSSRIKNMKVEKKVLRGDSAEREWRRELKRKVEEAGAPVGGTSSSAEGGVSAFGFWCELARNGISSGRWGHDGFEKLKRSPSPLPIRTAPKFIHRGPQHIPFRLRDRSPSPSAAPSSHSPSSSSSSSCESEKLKRKKKHKRKKSKRSRHRSKTENTSIQSPHQHELSSFSSNDDIEWTEKT